MSDYEKLNFRLLDVGLNLRDISDTVKQGEWVRFKNIKPTFEGSINTRPGRTFLYDSTSGVPVHTIKRIGDSTILLGSGTSIYRTNSVIGNPGYSGNPLTLAMYRPTTSTDTWAYVGDSLQSRKIKDDGTDFKWGISAPVNPNGASADGSGNLDSTVAGALVYDWRYTYYSSVTGAESNPSPEMGSGIAVVGQFARISVEASTDAQVDTIRIYRRGGTLPLTWLLVGTLPNGNGNYTDNASDSSLAIAKSIDLDNYVPFTSVDSAGDDLFEVPLPYVWGPFLGKYIMGSGDPSRPGYLYWTNPGRPDTANISNNIQVSSPTEPLLPGVIYNGLPYVFSRDNLYAIDFGGPDAIPTFTTRKTPCGRGLSSPWGFTVGPAIWFVSQDGIYVTDGQTPAQNISDKNIRSIFRGFTSQGIAPIDFTQPNYIRLVYGGLELHFHYMGTDGVLYHFAFNLLYDRWRQEDTTPSFSETVSYQDENQTTSILLIGDTLGKLYTVGGTTDNGVDIHCNVRTGSIDYDDPQTLKELGNVIIDADNMATFMTITPYYDAETIVGTPFIIDGTGRQKFAQNLLDQYIYSMAFDFSWVGPASLYQFTALWRLDQEEVTHWEFPETTHGLEGWQHVRDMYIVCRSEAPLTLTLTIDGVVYTYADQLPSTGGEVRKQHVWVQPIRGKVIRYAIDSELPFRIYGEDCEVRVKPWNTGLGYKLISPFRTPGGLTPRPGAEAV